MGNDGFFGIFDLLGFGDKTASGEAVEDVSEAEVSRKLQRMVKDLDVHALVIDTYNKAGFGKERGSMGSIGGAAGKAYDADNIITLTAGERTNAGHQIFADIVKSRDGEFKESRIGLIRETSKPVIRGMTPDEYDAMKAVQDAKSW